jgi:hypothetical protein
MLSTIEPQTQQRAAEFIPALRPANGSNRSAGINPAARCSQQFRPIKQILPQLSTIDPIYLQSFHIVLFNRWPMSENGISNDFRLCRSIHAINNQPRP